MADSVLLDRFARKVDYLRLSVTDRCDFRCVYCMAEDMTFLPRQQILSLEEILAVAQSFVALGTRKIRLTGGGPLVRSGIVGLCERIAALPGLRGLCLSTNGSQVSTLAVPSMERVGVGFGTGFTSMRWGDSGLATSFVLLPSAVVASMKYSTTGGRIRSAGSVTL